MNISIDTIRRLFDWQTNRQTDRRTDQPIDHQYNGSYLLYTVSVYSIFNEIYKIMNICHNEWNEIISYQRIYIQWLFDRFWYAIVVYFRFLPVWFVSLFLMEFNTADIGCHHRLPLNIFTIYHIA